jgi:hypothetical protein
MEGEIVTETRLDKFPWPETDPRLLPQVQRQRRPDETALLGLGMPPNLANTRKIFVD